MSARKFYIKKGSTGHKRRRSRVPDRSQFCYIMLARSSSSSLSHMKTNKIQQALRELLMITVLIAVMILGLQGPYACFLRIIKRLLGLVRPRRN